MYLMKHFFLGLLLGITVKIRVKCYVYNLLIGFTSNILVISKSGYFIGLSPGYSIKSKINLLENQWMYQEQPWSNSNNSSVVISCKSNFHQRFK